MLFFCCCFLFSQSNKKEIDYIRNYYQFVYEANYNFKIGNDSLAYKLLKNAEKNCPLLNQTGIYEIKILAILSMKFKKHNEALDYIELMMKKFGYKINEFERDSIFNPLKESKKWKKLKKKSNSFYENYLKTLNFELRKEIKDIILKDQEVRSRGNIDWKEVDSIDQIHEGRLKEIVFKYGYPDEKIIGKNYLLMNDEMESDISVLIMHLKDVEYWKPIFLDLIRKGKAPTDIYGCLIDSNLRNKSHFIYGIYVDAKPDKIIDFDNINKRRIEVGLSTWELQQKNYELMKKESELYNAN